MQAILIGLILFIASCALIEYLQFFSKEAIKRKNLERRHQESDAAAMHDLYDSSDSSAKSRRY
ncbi:hypothetical protein KRR38_22110 [Novosphingobium sp. G106]|uniref:hypothetical protein n=1 Tax=Novosphingobium sp. G106 TaxID=2849500 RepID=UPI001C2CCD2D|nr:hypothetical protein [Novosphingobium sp. G106]MBV1690302.1 hypothetical protein [Novosphingobium sp. G106]